MKLEQARIKQIMCELSCTTNTPVNRLNLKAVQQEAERIAKQENKLVDPWDIPRAQLALFNEFRDKPVSPEQLRRMTGYEESKKPVSKSDDVIGGTTPFSTHMKQIQSRNRPPGHAESKKPDDVIGRPAPFAAPSIFAQNRREETDGRAPTHERKEPGSNSDDVSGEKKTFSSRLKQIGRGAVARHGRSRRKEKAERSHTHEEKKAVSKRDDGSGGTTTFSAQSNQIQGRQRPASPIVDLMRNLADEAAERSRTHEQKIAKLAAAPSKASREEAITELGSALGRMRKELQPSKKMKAGERQELGDGEWCIRAIARFDLAGHEPPLVIDEKTVERVEVRMGGQTKNIEMRMTFAGGEQETGFLRAADASANKAQFSKLIEIGSLFDGNRFEHDRSGSGKDHGNINWDVEMTDERTLRVYRGHVYPAIAGSIDRLVEAELIPRDAVVFDVGCGRGDLAAVLHTRQPDMKIFGGELNQASLREAQSRWSSNDRNPPVIFSMDAVNGLRRAATGKGIRPHVVVMSGFIAKKVLDPESDRERELGTRVMRQVLDILPPGGFVVMAQKTDNLFSARELENMGFHVLNTWDPEHQRELYILRKPDGK